jgi:hypothetical protein
MLNNPQPIQSNNSTNRFECSIELIISPLSTEGFETDPSDHNPTLPIGIFNFNPGWQNKDWIEIQNFFSLVDIKSHSRNLKAQVVRQERFIECKENNPNEAILRLKIILEAEDRDFILKHTEKLDKILKNQANQTNQPKINNQE